MGFHEAISSLPNSLQRVISKMFLSSCIFSDDAAELVGAPHFRWTTISLYVLDVRFSLGGADPLASLTALGTAVSVRFLEKPSSDYNFEGLSQRAILCTMDDPFELICNLYLPNDLFRMPAVYRRSPRGQLLMRLWLFDEFYWAARRTCPGVRLLKWRRVAEWMVRRLFCPRAGCDALPFLGRRDLIQPDNLYQGINHPRECHG